MGSRGCSCSCEFSRDGDEALSDGEEALSESVCGAGCSDAGLSEESEVRSSTNET